MAEPVVVNASPLIFLAGAGLAELLQLAGTPVLIPTAVVDEIERFGSADTTVMARKQSPWLEVVESGPIPALIELWDLGSGESAVLTWAHAHPRTSVVLDDLAAHWA